MSNEVPIRPTQLFRPQNGQKATEKLSAVTPPPSISFDLTFANQFCLESFTRFMVLQYNTDIFMSR